MVVVSCFSGNSTIGTALTLLCKREGVKDRPANVFFLGLICFILLFASVCFEKTRFDKVRLGSFMALLVIIKE